MKISCVIITYNEERNIERCLKSVLEIADEIIVLDSFSTDKTKDICLNYKVRFFQQNFAGYSGQKNYANSLANFDYILSIDADEEVSETLKNSILEIKKTPTYDVYEFNRMSMFCGRWIHHSHYYPDRKQRIWKKGTANWEGKIHEKLKFEGKPEIFSLKGDLLHYPIENIEEFIVQQNDFSKLKSEELFEKGKRSNILRIIFKPMYKFIYTYFLRLGFLDGFEGFIFCSLSACFDLVTQLKLKTIQNKARKN